MHNIYDKVINSPYLQVKVILPNTTDKAPSTSNGGKSVILGYLENPFDVKADAEWSDKLFGRDYATTMNNVLGLTGNNTQAYTILDTTQNYITAQIPVFNVSFYVIATSSMKNPMDEVMRLYEAIYPEKVNSTLIKYHWGYTPNALGSDNGSVVDLEGQGSATNGTVILTIGQWFRAFNMLIKNVNITYSESLTPDHKPLYAKVNLTLTPRRLPYAKEFIQMFIP